jgi:hypothetical protein
MEGFLYRIVEQPNIFVGFGELSYNPMLSFDLLFDFGFADYGLDSWDAAFHIAWAV